MSLWDDLNKLNDRCWADLQKVDRVVSLTFAEGYEPTEEEKAWADKVSKILTEQAKDRNSDLNKTVLDEMYKMTFGVKRSDQP